jgi:hypothetical protein
MQKTSLWALTSLALAACGGGGSPNPPPVGNAAPVFTSAATASVAENTAGVFYTATASDADGDALTFSISAGADAARFSITSAGALRFASPPDFENPSDANRDNVYEVTLRVSDASASATLDLRVTVTDVAENFAIRRIAVGLSQPLFVLGRGDGTNRVFIVEKAGQIEILNLTTGLLNTTPFLDLTGTISTDGERGLLGMALAPDFATSGVFYLNLTNAAGNTEIRQYRRSAANADIADPNTQNVILTATQPASNHNGGWLGFGPDNLLYIALGDGGGSNDQFGNGQNLNTLLGKILRIDPGRDDFASDPLRDYGIPSGNPFASGGGRPEIFAYGLRNPFRASFDRQTGDLYIGDVGEGAIEEIDLIPRGQGGLNFGWPILEGTRVNQAGSTNGMTPPVAEYAHGTGATQGNSVTGGYVYRGPVAGLQGQYVFADFISNNVWSIPVSSISQGTTIAASSFVVRTSQFTPDLGILDRITSFGEDDAANLFITGIDGEVFQLQTQ